MCKNSIIKSAKNNEGVKRNEGVLEGVIEGELHQSALYACM
jgi:hypothetical protein